MVGWALRWHTGASKDCRGVALIHAGGLDGHDLGMAHYPQTRTSNLSRMLTAMAVGLAFALMLLVLETRVVEAAPAPTATGVSPALGPSAGGTTITITGTGFASGATVTVGGVAATSVTFVSATTITAVTPAGTPGSALVTVTNADTQAATLSGGFTYQFPPPTTSLIAPATGSSAGGTAVTITGTQFRAGAAVTFGTSAATNVVVVNATTITATAPARPIGATSVIVANSDAQSATLASAYTYTAATAPTVTSVSPSSGTVAGGTSVTITGTSFVSGATVTFGGTASSSVTVSSATSIVATSPARGSTGLVAIAVSNPDTQTGIIANAFTYNPLPAPTVTTIAATSGPAAGGTSVTITGTNFVAGASVTVGGSALSSATVVNATTITGSTPAHSAGVGSVIVSNPDGQSASLINAFTWAANAAPTATGITPSSGGVAGGEFLQIAGTGFLPGATVMIGGAYAYNLNVPSSTSITAYAPAHAVGVATVLVMNPDGQTVSVSGDYTYKLDAAPTITSVSPKEGGINGGTVVTITGTGFKTGPVVTIGGVPTTVVSASTTSIRIYTFPGTAGAADVIMTNIDGQAVTSTGGFTYQSDAPYVSGITPDGGVLAGGTIVTITGAGFLKGATVNFGSVAATSVAVLNSSEISATVPAGTAAGYVDVSVKNTASAAGILNAGFMYRAAGSATVATAPPVGGIVIVVAGTTDLQGLISAQKFPVSAVYLLDVAKQQWKVYIAGAPASVNTLSALKVTDIVLLRR